MHYLPGDTYTELYQYLFDEYGQSAADAFASYFGDPVNGLYPCTNESGYMNWLDTYLELGGDYGLFTEWSTNIPGQSGQGSGTGNIIPLP